MLGGNAARIAAGEPPLEPTPPRAATLESPSSILARIHQYLSMATPLLWTRQADTIGVLGLALNACDERNGHREELDRIRELLSTARDLWRPARDRGRQREAPGEPVRRFGLIHLADIWR